MPNMTPTDQVLLLRQASMEMKQLRAQISQLQPKAQAYDNLSAVIAAMRPRELMGRGEDLAWMLDQVANEIEQTTAVEAKGKTEVKS